MEKFIIGKNDYLSRDVEGYFNCYYRGYKEPGNPDFINTLKNTFNNIPLSELISAKNNAVMRIRTDLQTLINQNRFTPCTIVCIPRAKELRSYTSNQLFFIQAVSEAARMVSGAADGTTCIQRHSNTKTTHLKRETGRTTAYGKENRNNGPSPYPGITKDTCYINQSLIRGKNVILVDDIYTKSCNVDEDCLEALYNLGANKVIFYSIAYTQRI